ncbi:MAG TPA: prolipoprotein diacylglyceryl transferase [Clostridiaceae bacterium]|nr:prolipoprotein diacylglyceryl transferase [Clostridiaceae bacterium]
MGTIEFPGLGLKFYISRVAFSVFGIPIYWYGIIVAFGFLLAVLLGMKSSKKFGIEPDTIIDLVLFAAPVAIVTSRLYYVIFSWKDFKNNPLDIFNTRKGGLAIYGAVIGAVVVAYIFAKKKKIGVLKLFDFGAPYLLLGQGIGRWGNFVNQEAYGTTTDLPWGMTGSDIGPNPVHPTFLYESLWDFAVFFFLIWFRKRKKVDGEVFFLYMILYGFGRFWIEGLRTDSLMLGSIRVSQFLAAIFVIVMSIIFFIRRKKYLEASETVEIGTSNYASVLQRIREEESMMENMNVDGEGEATAGENESEFSGGVENADIVSGEDAENEEVANEDAASEEVASEDASSEDAAGDESESSADEEEKNVPDDEGENTVEDSNT